MKLPRFEKSEVHIGKKVDLDPIKVGSKSNMFVGHLSPHQARGQQENMSLTGTITNSLIGHTEHLNWIPHSILAVWGDSPSWHVQLTGYMV